MLPYWQLQLGYVLLSGVLSGLAWWSAGRLAFLRPLRHGLLLRFLCGQALVGLVVLMYALFVSRPGVVASGFGAVALGFWSGTLWLPLLALGTLLSRGLRRATPAPTSRALPVLVPLACVAVGVYSHAIEPNRLVVREESIEVPQWPADAAPLRIVHVSDLQSVGWCRREDEAAAHIQALEPDLIAISGDYIAGPFFDSQPAEAAARAFLEKLSAPLGVVVVGGHSERHAHRQRIFEGLDLLYLQDELAPLELDDGRRLEVIGLRAFGVDPRVLSQPKREGALRVVVSHVPGITHRLTGLGVDLHLAGHTHGGQIVVPGFGPPMTLSRLPRAYARGLFRWDDHWLNVTAGIGMEGNHAPRIRFNCPPEVCLLVLEGGRAA